MIVPSVGQHTSPVHGETWNRWGTVAVVLVIVNLALTYSTARTWWWQTLLVPPLTVLGIFTLLDPLSGIGVAVGVALTLALYGSIVQWVVRTAGLLATVPIAVSLTPVSMGRTLVWYEPPVLGLIPAILLISVLMRCIYVILVQQERASARDAALARTGTAILGATDLAEVHRLGSEAAAEIVALHPGIGWLVARRTPDGLTVLSVAELADDVRGRVLPDEVVTDPGRLVDLVPRYRHWRVDSFPGDVHVLLGSARPVPEAVFAAIRTLSNQVLLGERMIESRVVLDHQANHDHLTQLVTRARFFRQVSAAVDACAGGSVALLNIDLDDFKRVNDTHGHAAGDALLVEVAARMRSLGVPGATPARFGGDEFAVLLTGLIRPEDAELIAERLCHELTRPVRVTDGTVTVGASIGVAVAEPGHTAADLIRCADIAMYSAKAQGKNRVERFDADRHGETARQRAPQIPAGEPLAR